MTDTEYHKNIRKDQSTTVRDLRTLTANFVNERKWKRYHTLRALSEAISIEAAELLENFLFRTDEEVSKLDREKITDEMADIVIYLMSLCNALELESFSECVYKRWKKTRLNIPLINLRERIIQNNKKH